MKGKPQLEGTLSFDEHCATVTLKDLIELHALLDAAIQVWKRGKVGSVKVGKVEFILADLRYADRHAHLARRPIMRVTNLDEYSHQLKWVR